MEALVRLGHFFSDKLSIERQLDYWEAMADEITLDEWLYALRQAKKRHRFHKIPLPNELMDYVYELRHMAQEARAQAYGKWEREQRLLAQAERVALEASPEWQEAERQRKEELQRMQDAAEQKLARTLGPDWRDVDTHHQIPGRIAGENLTYTPQTDTEAAKARLRAQIAQVMAEEAQRKEEA